MGCPFASRSLKISPLYIVREIPLTFSRSQEWRLIRGEKAIYYGCDVQSAIVLYCYIRRSTSGDLIGIRERQNTKKSEQRRDENSWTASLSENSWRRCGGRVLLVVFWYKKQMSKKSDVADLLLLACLHRVLCTVK